MPEEKKSEAVPETANPFSSELFAQAMEARASSDPNSPKPSMHRDCTFIMSASECVPGTFPMDFKVTLRSLTSRQETAAAKGVSEPMEVGTALSKMALFAVNGTPLKGQDEKEWLWDHLASGGRQIIIAMYSTIGMAKEDAVKKAESSLVSS